MCLDRVTPVIKVPNIEKAKEFYLGFLSFDIDWEYILDEGRYVYLQISKDNCVLHLTEYCDDGCTGTSVRIETNDLSQYQKTLIEKGYHGVSLVVKDMEWGTKDMEILDPFGNKLIFTSGILTD